MPDSTALWVSPVMGKTNFKIDILQMVQTRSKKQKQKEDTHDEK